MSTDSTPIKLTVTFRGAQHGLSVLPDSTLAALQAQLEELTSVPPSLQKLLHKGKKTTSTSQDDITTLLDIGLKNGMKIQLLGATMKELSEMKASENAQRKRENILRERASKPQVKVRSTGPPPSQVYTHYRFHQLVPLPHLPDPSGALALLTKLSEDPAIRHVMQMHKFSVGVLTELAPHEHPHLLGLNVNGGQSIKLRLRTDGYDGFRAYREVRRVLCHELTHNIWGDHDENFKELNSKLNREVAEFEVAAAKGTHRLYQGDVYEPSSDLEAAEAQVHVLGGGDGGSYVESVEERRRKILSATMSRLPKRGKLEELDEQCGTGRNDKLVLTPPMAPIRSSSLRQGTLAFASTKRTASTSTAGKPNKVVRSPVAPISSSSESSPSGSEKSSSASVVEDDVGPLQQPSGSYKRREKEDRALRPAKRRHVSPAPEAAAPKPQSHAATEEVKDERPRLNPKDRRWTKVHAEAKKKMDYPTPIHSENQNKIHEILRVFDLSYEYGPCVGMSRLERWERAHAMGLKPPQEIREILFTAEGMDKQEFSQSVLYGEV